MHTLTHAHIQAVSSCPQLPRVTPATALAQLWLGWGGVQGEGSGEYVMKGSRRGTKGRCLGWSPPCSCTPAAQEQRAGSSPHTTPKQAGPVCRPGCSLVFFISHGGTVLPAPHPISEQACGKDYLGNGRPKRSPKSRVSPVSSEVRLAATGLQKKKPEKGLPALCTVLPVTRGVSPRAGSPGLRPQGQAVPWLLPQPPPPGGPGRAVCLACLRQNAQLSAPP